MHLRSIDTPQYFYTIKDLREAIVPLLHASGKSMDEDKLTDDDLKRHRVGGRLVTRKEILRSKKCLYYRPSSSTGC